MTDNNRSFSWPVLIGNGLLLLCALIGFTGSFLSLYGDPAPLALSSVRPKALDLCAVNGNMLLAYAALLGLATLAAWSLPRFWGGLAGGLTALWAAIVLWNRAEVIQGAGVTVREIAALFASRVSWGQKFSYETGLTLAQEFDAVQLFLLLALAGLALLLGWTVVRSRRWWMTMLLTLPPLLPGLLADLYPDWISFLALAACWCATLLTSLCRRAAPDDRGKLTLIMLPTAALTLALITAVFPREGYTRPAWARKAESGLLNIANRLSDYLPHWNNGPFQSTVTYVGAAEEADLVHAGPLNYTGRTVLRVTSDYGGWMYLRGSSLAVYEDGVWKALPDGTYGAYWSGQEPEVSPLYFPAMQEQNTPVYTVTVDNVGAAGSCVYAPYFPLPQDVNETGMLPVEDAYFARRQGQWSHTMTFADRYPSTRYMDILASGPRFPNINYIESVATDGGGSENLFTYPVVAVAAQTAASAYARYVYENYLDVPEDLREILEQSARFAYIATSYIPPDYEVWMAERLGSYLDALCEYDAEAPAAPEGVDPVYYFLTESHRGYCMHYASAVTLMLRSAGVPARYVSGFAAETFSGRRVDIPDRAAHAWVEVWVDGFGWYPVEVTPDDAFDWARPGEPETGEPEDTPESTLELPPDRTDPPQSTDAPDQHTASPPGSGGGMDGPAWVWLRLSFTALLNVLKRAAPVIAVLLLIWFVQFAVKRFRTWRMSGAEANRSALVCYGYLCRLGRWGGRMNPQAEELAQKARFSQHTLTEKELARLRYLVDRERTRLCALSRQPKRLVFRYWWGRPRVSVPPADSTPPKQKE